MKHCEQEMREVGKTGRTIQVGKLVKTEEFMWKQTGIKDEKIYQCDKCKHIEIL